MTSPVTGTFTSALADECAVFALVLEGLGQAQSIAGTGVLPRGQIGAGVISAAGIPPVVLGSGVVSRRAIGRGTLAVLPGPQYILGRGVEPR